MVGVAYRAPPRLPRRSAPGIIVFVGVLFLSACEDGTLPLAPSDGPDPTLDAPTFVAEAAGEIPSVIESLEDLRTWFLPESSHDFARRITPAVRAVERSLNAEDAKGLDEDLGTLATELARMAESDIGQEGLIALDVVELTARTAGRLLSEPAPAFDLIESGAEMFPDALSNLEGQSS